MTVDVLLSPTSVRLVADGGSPTGADRVVAETTDFEVNFPPHRSSPTPGGSSGSEMRRALVHDFDDALTVNYAGDYPAGVRVQGKGLDVEGALVITPATPVLVSPLLVEGQKSNALVAKQSFDVVAEIKALRAEILALRYRIESLEMKG
jgi:hypothetical protein